MDELLRLLLGTPMTPAGLDPLRVRSFIWEELHRIHRVLLQGSLSPGGSGLGGASPDAIGAPPQAGDVAALVQRARLLLLQHPIAAQAAFSALVAEGRRFAATPEGRTWATALAASPLMRHASALWGALGLDMLEEDPNTVLPTAWLDALLRSAESPNLAAARASPADSPGGEPRHGEPR
ncbi:hypothetical protein JY651_00220 [Pyxidicoccus parkwayensis]|uniref:TetR family transcriptional regulator n=1 Tax=Pyxidicoccus parkwayensis TaxID=2813578 RepID=A0ABX7P129_9BACT|nr:hypothetical protein [Pyxidicoccus parkwaysis]QSQ23449.1 hypothetical protein JY651_00220 [Pyxidicoccus parkwaysis]